MCVDFTDLNKACKKDDFPLERVDKIVDYAANSEMLSLLDMFSRYDQTRVRREDEEKTSFITPFGTFCFVRMPEGLKNVRMQDPVSVKDVQKLTGMVAALNKFIPKLQKKACLSFKFSEAPITFNGPKLRSKKNSKTICQT
jgi:hypothetical protein